VSHEITARRQMQLLLCLFSVFGAAAFLFAAHVAAQRQPRPAAPTLPRAGAVGQLEQVAEFTTQMPTGVTVSQAGRIFVNFPRWEDPVEYTVAELRDGKAVPYPDASINRLDTARAGETFVSVQSVVIDPRDRLWIVDTGSINFNPVVPAGPKLVCVDLSTNRIINQMSYSPDGIGECSETKL